MAIDNNSSNISSSSSSSNNNNNNNSAMTISELQLNHAFRRNLLCRLDTNELQWLSVSPTISKTKRMQKISETKSSKTMSVQAAALISFVPSFILPFSKSQKKTSSSVSLDTMSTSSTESLNNEVFSFESALHKPNNRSKGKNVTFQDTVKTIENMLVISEDEKQAAWIQRDEYLAYRKEARETAKLLKKSLNYAGMSEEEQELLTTVCSRGVEKLADARKEEAATQRRRSIAAVLLEQETQTDECICDPELIALAYGECTQYSIECAYLQGLEDERESQHLR